MGNKVTRKRSVSKSISQDQDPRDGDFATAVLAAAFVIHSIEEAKSNNEIRRENGFRDERLPPLPHSKQVTKQSSYNKTKNKTGKFSTQTGENAGEASMKKLSSITDGSLDGQEKLERHEKLKTVLENCKKARNIIKTR